ncbi:MAG: hypothetical protein N2490_01575 [Ignavibacteria bacterium]|nr:hypothetical protein [Ignavibacteria bacterium]
MNRNLFILVIVLLISVLAFSQTERRIAYSCDNSSNGFLQIFTMDLDGNNKRQLTNLPYDCIYPKWSPDGSKIVFYTQADKSSSSIYLIDNITDETADDPIYLCDGTNPSFLCDNNIIMFNSDVDGVLTIYVKILGENDIYLLGPDSYANQQVLSHDCRWLAFATYTESGKSIMMYDLTDTTDDALYSVSKNNNANMNPDISADNSKIVYSSFDKNLNGTIYIYEDGIEKVLTKGIKSADMPKFSPDGNKIAFIAIENDKTKLCLMNIDGSGIEYLKTYGSNVLHYQWVDNENIIYDAEKGDITVICIINLKTGENKVLTDGYNCVCPDVSNPFEIIED